MQTAKSTEESNRAEQLLLQYRALGFDTEVLWYALEHSSSPQAQFETARTLSLAFVRELQTQATEPEVVSARLQKLGSALWSLVLSREAMSAYVAREFLRCIFSSLKQAWGVFDDRLRSQSIQTLCFDVLERRKQNPCDNRLARYAAMAVDAVVREFSLAVGTLDARMPMEQHIALHLYFQVRCLELGLLTIERERKH